MLSSGWEIQGGNESLITRNMSLRRGRLQAVVEGSDGNLRSQPDK